MKFKILKFIFLLLIIGICSPIKNNNETNELVHPNTNNGINTNTNTDDIVYSNSTKFLNDIVDEDGDNKSKINYNNS